MALSPGSLVADRYRLIRPLGEGGMGEVWEATNTVTGRLVAIKRLRPSLAMDRDGRSRSRFVLEAQAACAVEHPHVVEILDFVETASEPPVIVMELLQGETLAAKLTREQSLSVEESARILLPVVSAVGTAHARGIVHRDLKPANVFLEQSGARVGVKVLDFGIAKWLAPHPQETPLLRTETGSTVGTPCYMAPEQAMGDKVIDQRADVWSLGVILYECLSGVRPVEGENAARIIVRLLSTGIIPIEHLVPGLPRELSLLVGRMLSREQSLRPTSLNEVAAVLQQLTSAWAPAFGEPTVPLAPASDTPPTWGGERATPIATPIERPRARRLWPAGVAVALVASGAIAWNLRARPRAAEPMPVESAAGAPPLATLAAAPPGAASPSARATATSTSDTSHVPAPGPSARSSRAASAARPLPSGANKGTKPAPRSELAPSTASLPSGTACERSRECQSRICLAFVCR